MERGPSQRYETAAGELHRGHGRCHRGYETRNLHEEDPCACQAPRARLDGAPLPRALLNKGDVTELDRPPREPDAARGCRIHPEAAVANFPLRTARWPQRRSRLKKSFAPRVRSKRSPPSRARPKPSPPSSPARPRPPHRRPGSCCTRQARVRLMGRPTLEERQHPGKFKASSPSGPRQAEDPLRPPAGDAHRPDLPGTRLLDKLFFELMTQARHGREMKAYLSPTRPPPRGRAPGRPAWPENASLQERKKAVAAVEGEVIEAVAAAAAGEATPTQLRLPLRQRLLPQPKLQPQRRKLQRRHRQKLLAARRRLRPGKVKAGPKLRRRNRPRRRRRNQDSGKGTAKKPRRKSPRRKQTQQKRSEKSPGKAATKKALAKKSPRRKSRKQTAPAKSRKGPAREEALTGC